MDLRVKKTYKALVDAYTKLLRECRFDDITVANLCDEAMIRRTTFYKHFADKGAFFSFYVGRIRTEMVERGIEAAGCQPGEAMPTADDERRAILGELADFLLEHEKEADNIMGSSMAGIFYTEICDKTAEAFAARMRRELGLDPEATLSAEYAARAEFAAGGVVRHLMLWWLSGARHEYRDDFVRVSNEHAARVLA